MDIKQIIQFCTIKNERLYTFNVPSGAPLGELYDATFEILNEIVKHIQDSAQKAAPKDIPIPEIQVSKIKGD